ncbi:hypothetical protein EDC01DRAFT_636290 [Geopyxis carbonaria]|nr:hypothetical protein EDC01DRAFT_636290 [Geopyxis carbonaria]
MNTTREIFEDGLRLVKNVLPNRKKRCDQCVLKMSSIGDLHEYNDENGQSLLCNKCYINSNRRLWRSQKGMTRNIPCYHCNRLVKVLLNLLENLDEDDYTVRCQSCKSEVEANYARNGKKCSTQNRTLTGEDASDQEEDRSDAFSTDATTERTEEYERPLSPKSRIRSSWSLNYAKVPPRLRSTSLASQQSVYAWRDADNPNLIKFSNTTLVASETTATLNSNPPSAPGALSTPQLKSDDNLSGSNQTNENQGHQRTSFLPEIDVSSEMSDWIQQDAAFFHSGSQ